jgi:hypothetical protein
MAAATRQELSTGREGDRQLGAAASPAPEANANTSSPTIDALTRFSGNNPTFFCNSRGWSAALQLAQALHLGGRRIAGDGAIGPGRGGHNCAGRHVPRIESGTTAGLLQRRR